MKYPWVADSIKMLYNISSFRRHFMKKVFNSIHRTHRTLIHYFLSYFILLSFLLVSFLFIVRIQLSRSYLDMLNQQANQQLSHIKTQFSNGLATVSQINSSLANNINLALSRHTDNPWKQYVASQEINSYAIANDMIQGIVYYDAVRDKLYSTGKYVKYTDGVFHIFDDKSYTVFNPDEYQDSITNQLISVKGENASYLIYYPYHDKGMGYTLFYIINEISVSNMLKGILSEEIISIALVGSDNQIAVGVNSSLLAPHLSAIQDDTEVCHLDSQTSLQVSSGLYSGFKMVAMISDKAIMDRINAILSRTYLILFLLGVAGMLIVLFAMRRTYLPLSRLTRKIIKNPAFNQSYLEQLDLAFSDAAAENKNLQNKIEKYRLSMQKSILDSIVADRQVVAAESLGQMGAFDRIDPFFTMEPDNLIFALRMRISPKLLPANSGVQFQEIALFLKGALPEKSSCLMLEYDRDTAMFLLSYPGMEQRKEEALLALLENYCEEREYLSALSNGSSSPMDIPSLYENAMLASREWSHRKVASFGAMDSTLPGEHVLTYPYELLDGLAQALKDHDFKRAESGIQQLSALLDGSFSTENTLPDFFVRCVLIDILTALINAMNQMNVKFKDYRDTYFEALYFCRSFPYQEKKQEIQSHIGQLLALFVSEAENQLINAAQIEQLVDENFTSADFSISYLADNFHVSIAYMSYLFKKEMGENFSDYVWNLRLGKAKELLLNTDMSIDDISLAVGYVNTSSFRRKFKQATGMTPSQLRG